MTAPRLTPAQATTIPMQTTQCQWCMQTEAVEPCEGWLIVASHVDRSTGKKCVGIGIVVGRVTR